MKSPAIFRAILLIAATALAACTGVNTQTRFAESRTGGTLATKAERSISTSP